MSANPKQARSFPPCRKACPADVNVQAYIALASRGRFREAMEVVREKIPLPGVCGRICFSPCEEACTRKDVDDPLGIRAVKRLVSDFELAAEKNKKPNPMTKKYDEKVAIIGSGPAGLAAAYELIRMGYPVTVFERSSKTGGMLRDCIPNYRLPKGILDTEIQYLLDLGLEIRPNTTFGKELTVNSLFDQGYKAVFIAIGAQKCLSLNCEGEDLKGVMHSLEFLRAANAGEQVKLGQRVAVIGGGNVAIDAARTAKRLISGEVTVIYRRSEEEMPAHRQELEEARNEDVKFVFLASPKRFVGKEGKVVSVECVRMRLGPPDDSGRRRPIPIENSEFSVLADSVILAIGETPDASVLPAEVETTERGTIVCDPATLQTRMRGVFAGGDVVSGPASAIEAIAAGKKAAVSIDRYLRDLDLKADREESICETTWFKRERPVEKKPKQVMPSLEASERVGNFEEVELGFNEEVCIGEASRCLFCGPCSQCLESLDLCESDEAVVDEDKCIACANCEKVCDYGAIKIDRSVARVDETICKGCGTCAVECPAVAISMSNPTNEKILGSIKRAQRNWGKNGPRVFAFVCDWSHGGRANRLEDRQNAYVVPVKCAGRVDPLHILAALEKGADGVLIIGCQDSDCHYAFGAPIAEKRVREAKEWLKALGMRPERVKIERNSVNKERDTSRIIADFACSLEEIGANSPQRN